MPCHAAVCLDDSNRSHSESVTRDTWQAMVVTAAQFYINEHGTWIWGNVRQPVPPVHHSVAA
jgi:hypothetical protein